MKGLGDMIIGLVEKLGVMLFKLLWWLFKHPLIWVPCALVGAAYWYLGPWVCEAAVGFVVLSLVSWRLLARVSYRRFVSKPIRDWWILTWRYKIKWRMTMIDAGMLKVLRSRPDRVPKIKRFVSNGWSDRILVKLVRGQTIEQLQKAAPSIASAFEMDECRIKFDRAGYAWIVFPISDPLAQTIEPFPIDEKVDLENVPVGMTDEGDVWTIPMTSSKGANMLVVATMGGGKSGAAWALIWGAAAMIRDGLVQMWVADPKNGVEFKRGKPLFYRYADTPDDIMKMLKELKVVMVERGRRQADGARMHEPTVEEPLIYVNIDEILAITAFLKSSERIAFEHIIGLLLTQGRALGIVVMVCSQDATKDMLRIRGFFSRQWAGRLNEPIQVDMVLGDGARAAGARTDDHRVVPQNLPGVGFMRIEGVREPVRVRSYYVTDDHIDYLVQNYAPVVNASNDMVVDKVKTRTTGKTVARRVGEIDPTPIQMAEVESWQRFFEEQVQLERELVQEQDTIDLEVVEG